MPSTSSIGDGVREVHSISRSPSFFLHSRRKSERRLFMLYEAKSGRDIKLSSCERTRKAMGFRSFPDNCPLSTDGASFLNFRRANGLKL